MAIKRTSTSEAWVFIWIVVPYVFGVNLILFGSCVLHSILQFALAFVYSVLYLLVAYFFFGIVALRIRKRFPAAGDLFKRISIMLPVFYLMNIGLANGMAYFYTELPLINCPVKVDMIGWCVLYGCIMSTAITFMNEGVANFEIWRASLSENEKLRNMYRRSKLLGLKAQINPHFLFNCFNTLSGLIDEDEQKAEKFLEEMTKVHRYLLGKEDEMFVPLHDELKFAESYLYLIKQRFGTAIEITMNMPKSATDRYLPPFSMQAVLENVIYTNSISKLDPLLIIVGVESDQLEVRHSVHDKKIVENLGTDEGLDNLINKYVLLKAGDVEIVENKTERIIKLPLLEEKEITL